VIKPQVGMPVLFHPAPFYAGDELLRGDQPLAAQISYVWSDTCVNLVVFDMHGTAVQRTSVTLHQDDEPLQNTRWCQFPDWFVAFTKPRPCPHCTPIGRFGGPMPTVRDALSGLPPTSPQLLHAIGAAVPAPAVTPDNLVAGCQPTSQVNG
jgi:hypothetical protein